MIDDELMTATQSRVLPVAYAQDGQFLTAYDDPSGALVLPPTAGQLKEGEKLALSIQVAGHPGRVVVRGTVSPFRSTEGASVLKVRPEDRGRLRKAAALLQDGAKGPVRDERLSTDDVPVEYQSAGLTLPATVRDLSTGGCFLSTAARLPSPQETVVLAVKPPGARFFKLHVKARVTWVDEVEGARGFGVRFEDGQRDKVERFLFTVLVED